jgi:hypothetical protein
MIVGPTKRPGFEMSSLAKSAVIADLGSPLVGAVCVSGELDKRRKGTLEHERHSRYSHIPTPRSRERATVQQVSFERGLAVDACHTSMII